MAIKSVALELDKVYNLRFGMGAEIKYEQLTGEKVSEIDLENFSMVQLANLLWVMIIDGDSQSKNLLLVDVARLVDEYASDIASVYAKLNEAVGAAWTVDEKTKNSGKSKNQL